MLAALDFVDALLVVDRGDSWPLAALLLDAAGEATDLSAVASAVGIGGCGLSLYDIEAGLLRVLPEAARAVANSGVDKVVDRVRDGLCWCVWEGEEKASK